MITRWRVFHGLAGEVDVAVLYEPRPGYGRDAAVLDQRGALGVWAGACGVAFVLRSDLPLQLADDRRSASGRALIHAGEHAYLSFAYAEEAPMVEPPLGELARDQIARSARWWREWADRCSYRGPYRDIVVRSALVLKLMAYAPSGAVVAAPTTSLPEHLGGQRNWDYRHCWWRDASLMLRALFVLGYDAEGLAFLSWMLHATRLTWPELQCCTTSSAKQSCPSVNARAPRGICGVQSSSNRQRR